MKSKRCNIMSDIHHLDESRRQYFPNGTGVEPRGQRRRGLSNNTWRSILDTELKMEGWHGERPKAKRRTVARQVVECYESPMCHRGTKRITLSESCSSWSHNWDKNVYLKHKYWNIQLFEICNILNLAVSRTYTRCSICKKQVKWLVPHESSWGSVGRTSDR